MRNGQVRNVEELRCRDGDLAVRFSTEKRNKKGVPFLSGAKLMRPEPVRKP